jgi:hypothetical protein
MSISEESNNHSKELGRNHMVSKEYTYLLYCNQSSEFYHDLMYSNKIFLGNHHCIHGAPYIKNGYNEIEGIQIWVVNQIKQ